MKTIRFLPFVKENDTSPPGVSELEIITNVREEYFIWVQEKWCAVDTAVKSQKVAENDQEKLGVRFNSNKTRFDLIPQSWIRVLAQILTQGAKKYALRNWEKGISWSETLASLHRHLDAWISGEKYDPETKCHHLGHVAWNALALMTFELRGIGKPDIPADNDETMENES